MSDLSLFALGVLVGQLFNLWMIIMLARESIRLLQDADEAEELNLKV